MKNCENPGKISVWLAPFDEYPWALVNGQCLGAQTVSLGGSASRLCGRHNGDPISYKRLPHKPDSAHAQKKLSYSSDQQPEGPSRHFLLGLEICLSALGVFCAFRLILFGWAKLATDGFERLLNGQKRAIARLLGGFGLALLGAVIGAFSLVYWLVRNDLGRGGHLLGMS